MRHLFSPRTHIAGILCVVVVSAAGLAAVAQSVHEAPSGAPSGGRVTSPGEPGQPLSVSGFVSGPDGAPMGGASLYVYQTDHEGYYGVKPASDNRNPRLKLFLRTDTLGRWSFEDDQARFVPERPRAGAHPLRSFGSGPCAIDLRDCLRGGDCLA